MKSLLIALFGLVLVSTLGCTLLFGKFQPVVKCDSKGVSDLDDLKDAPVWVPDAPLRASMPSTGCVSGDGSHYTDRLCEVGKLDGTGSIVQAVGTVKKKSLRLLGDKLELRLTDALSSSIPQPTAAEIKTFSKQLRDSVGRVTATWQSPNCQMYGIAELKRVDFDLVVSGPSLPAGSKALLSQAADQIVGAP